MRMLDLFSGFGGFTLAARHVWPDAETVAFVEIEPFAQDWLRANFPGVPIHSDIKEYKHDGTTIDLLTGGFPCQPVSVAGKRKGDQDDRYLWPEMLRVIQDVRPRWVIGENVSGLLSFNKGLLFDGIITDLEAAGYETGTFVLPACSQDAPHRRDRVWVVAHAVSSRMQKSRLQHTRIYSESGQGRIVGFSERGRTAQQEGGIGNESRRAINAGQNGGMADTDSERRQQDPGGSSGNEKENGRAGRNLLKQNRNYIFAGYVQSYWSDSAWLIGHDGKARRVPRSAVGDAESNGSSSIRSIPKGERTNGGRIYSSDERQRCTQSAFRGLDDGGPAEYDNENITLLVETFKHRADFLKMLGNSIVWPVVVPIMEAIREIEV